MRGAGPQGSRRSTHTATGPVEPQAAPTNGVDNSYAVRSIAKKTRTSDKTPWIHEELRAPGEPVILARLPVAVAELREGHQRDRHHVPCARGPAPKN